MAQSTTRQLPTKGIWLRFIALIPLVIVLAIGSWAYIRSVCSTYAAWTPPIEGETFAPYGLDDIVYDTPGVVEAVDIEHFHTGAARITFRAVSDGEVGITYGDDVLSTGWVMNVQDGAIIESGVNFSGWEAIHISICILLGAAAALFASVLVHLARRNWYDYEMVACGGGMLFTLFQLVLFAYLFARQSIRDYYDMLFQISSMADHFIYLSLVPMSVLALLVSISNIALICHEGLRPTNLLGIAISLVWIIVNFLWLWWWNASYEMDLPFAAVQIINCLIAVAIAFGECLLLSTIACAWLASRHVPKQAVDYLVVLGCGIRADGTPSPLLAGRVDRAREFDEARTTAGDAPAVFVPSGGQGPDEVVSEAQSMKDYLVGKGVAPERIVLEDRSTTTRENMAFSRHVIEQHADRGAETVSIAFSTTNYHVFRGYVCAHQAGMTVEGMGSKTRAYFWPNAFLREFAGLLVAQWRTIFQTYLAIAAIYAFANYMLIVA